MAENHHDVLATVDKFVNALATEDAGTLDALFTDDAVVWHNYDQVGQPAREALAALAGLAALQPRFEVVGRDVVDTVCIQRHVVHITLPGAEAASIPVIQRISVADRRIRRIDEYTDSAQMVAAVQALQAGV
ncbi:MAG TPA: nuclear transport factor 2 family protein [Mycobacterium sp.]|jgi:ketosteroid isomerase-like protein|nr:nuclear transport factor 2 family protein [Mycobacterium sp.]